MDPKNTDQKEIKKQQKYLDPTQKSVIKPSLLPSMSNRLDLPEKLAFGKPVKQDRLINLLNYLNFTGGHVFLHFTHPEYADGILLKVFPKPCRNSNLDCVWEDQAISNVVIDTYVFKHLLIQNGQALIIIPASLKKMSSNSILLDLPLAGYQICERSIQRYPCDGVQVEISQHGIIFIGEVVDFSPVSFQVHLNNESSQAFNRFNPNLPCYIKILKLEDIIFSGACEHIRNNQEGTSKYVVLAPLMERISRYKNVTRNPRRQLSPPPVFHFKHPFCSRRFKLQIHDISNSGFSVMENPVNRVLMPGMILPSATILFSGSLEIACKVQVIYCKKEDDYRVRCGIVILDMDIKSFSDLYQVNAQADDHHIYISSEIDMDALWEFFFDTGFIYPQKYGLIQNFRDDFKKTYKKIYEEHPEIARYFTYEKDGRIYGHISLIHAFERAWMIQHHASRPLENKLPGLKVLRSAILFLHGIYQMPSANMDFILGFYRPENKFPDKTFGGFSRYLNDPKKCSLDIFSYLLYETLDTSPELPEGYTVEECGALDLWQLNNFYKYHSGGILLEVLNLDADNPNDEVEKDYANLGFLRKLKAFSLSKQGSLCAVLIVNQSNLGINLSDLLNGIMIFIVNREDLSWKILAAAIEKLSKRFRFSQKTPLLFYPNYWVKSWNISYDKEYCLWALNLRFSDLFLEFMKKQLRLNYS